ncbi:hypothetical protein [Natronosalvus vescus]|uniref:hypothetical protein n=1 Tax=Natronosalvus vescus TaxID=2953881 RepID=UPI002090E8E0|nr:hypothetical protein [Natronosalvus vescus]
MSERTEMEIKHRTETKIEEGEVPLEFEAEGVKHKIICVHHDGQLDYAVPVSWDGVEWMISADTSATPGPGRWADDIDRTNSLKEYLHGCGAEWLAAITPWAAKQCDELPEGVKILDMQSD